LLTGFAGIGLAQALKVPLGFREHGRWDWSLVTGTGGMPSSHSAGVASLASYVALKKGISAIDFAICTLFGLIVMYDAMGIRRHAGEMAVEINNLDVQVERLADEHPGIYHQRRREELEEQLGHMPAEVAAGAVLGIAVGTASFLMGKGRRRKRFAFL
jgi:acid phosphatase family membrane protein YuiD